MILAALLLAAIVTESNNNFIIPAPAAKFVGTSSRPGIASQWIPYGTYTGGSGGTEYLRVTSNLVGVVYSAWDGCVERDIATSDGDLSPAPQSNRMYRVRGDKTIYGCDDTLRIMDWLNVGLWGWEAPFEDSIFRTDWSWDWSGDYQYITGPASYYGGRRLDALVLSAEPPIETSWSSTLPFRDEDLDAWATVWPTYSTMTNDLHFFPVDTNRVSRYFRRYIDWFYPSHLYSIWGDDVWGDPNDGHGYDLSEALARTPFPFTMEDVLGADTGWEYNPEPTPTNDFADDFTHWRNGTTRLDWKRLGIICQLERQMEQTYKVRNEEDYLPVESQDAMRQKMWEGTLEVDLQPPSSLPAEREVPLSDVTWGASPTVSLSVSTNAIGWSFPTARAVAPSVGGRVTGGNGNVHFDFSSVFSIRLSKDDYQNLVESCYGIDQLDDRGEYYFDAHLNLSVSDNPIGVVVQLTNCYVFWNDGGENENLGSIPVGDSYALVCGIEAATNFVATLYRTVVKSAAARWTHAYIADENEILKRFAAFPSTNSWTRGYVKSQTRPTLEVMLSTKGSGAAGFANNLDAMDWDQLYRLHRSTSSREFRMNPDCAAASTRTASDYNRLMMLRSIDSEVKDKFASLAGYAATRVAEVGTVITAGEETQIIDSLDRKKITMAFNVMPFNFVEKVRQYIDWGSEETYEDYVREYGWGNVTNREYDAIWIDATFSVSDGSIGNFTPYEIWSHDFHEYPDEDGSFLLAEAFWTFGEVEADAVTNRYDAVAVDGHQNQVIKTLWKFKNLRDPTL